MAKVAKTPQTDYTRGGKAISDTAIPLYQSNLTRMDEYLADPYARQNEYLSRYYENNTDTSDFLREYNRAMSGATAGNYTATSGGYSSANQRNYEDLQRYQNDLAARLRDTGVTSAYNMASNDYANMLVGNQSYQQAYQLGKAYSDVEQQNAIADQMNNNWLGNTVGAVGEVVSMIPLPQTQAIGAAMQIGGDMLTVQAPNSIAAGGQSGTVGTGAYTNPYSGIAGNAGTQLMNYAATNPNSIVGRLFGQQVNKRIEEDKLSGGTSNTSNIG